jgi:isopenicillin N synthase-like dioxygenase
MQAFNNIPAVSLADWHACGADRQAFADDVRRICHEVGFLMLVDHGIDQPSIDAWFEHLERFFALPEATKALIDKRNSPHFRGWERVGSEFTDNKVDVREQVDLWSEYPASVVAAEQIYLALEGPNQWLPEEVLPGFRDAAHDFFARMGALADELMEVFAVGLGLPASTFRDRFGERPMSLVKVISYPPTPRVVLGLTRTKIRAFSRCYISMVLPACRRSTLMGSGSMCRRLGERSWSTSAKCCKR